MVNLYYMEWVLIFLIGVYNISLIVFKLLKANSHMASLNTFRSNELTNRYKELQEISTFIVMCCNYSHNNVEKIDKLNLIYQSIYSDKETRKQKAKKIMTVSFPGVDSFLNRITLTLSTLIFLSFVLSICSLASHKGNITERNEVNKIVDRIYGLHFQKIKLANLLVLNQIMQSSNYALTQETSFPDILQILLLKSNINSEAPSPKRICGKF